MAVKIIRKMLMLAKAGKKNGCLIEGMACPGGCIAGAGTNIAIPQAMKEVNAFKMAAEKKIPEVTNKNEIKKLEEQKATEVAV